MPARRLLPVVALLLLALALAASIDTGNQGGTSDRAPASPAPREPPAESATVTATLAPNVRRPEPVRARVGDLVHLQVLGTAPDSVTIKGYDVVETVDAESPARFEFFAETPGSFPVRFQSDGRVAGVLEVRPRPAG